jgi:hypothetical protein
MSSRLLSTRQPLRYEIFDWIKMDLVPRWRNIALMYKGGAVLAGACFVYYMVQERGEIATTDSIISAFEAGNADWLNSQFHKDLRASVKRPLLEDGLVKLLRPDSSDHYAVVIGATGTGKSTAVRLAVRSLPGPKGVVYFSTPEILEDFSTELAVQVGYRGDAVDLGAAFYDYLHRSTRSTDPPSVDHEPLASWRPLRKRLVSAANKFFAKHNRPMVLVIDAFDRVCKENPRFAIQLQEFAKDGADNGSLRVVFVFSRDEALPLLTSRSAWERALQRGLWYPRRRRHQLSPRSSHRAEPRPRCRSHNHRRALLSSAEIRRCFCSHVQQCLPRAAGHQDTHGPGCR